MTIITVCIPIKNTQISLCYCSIKTAVLLQYWSTTSTTLITGEGE